MCALRGDDDLLDALRNVRRRPELLAALRNAKEWLSSSVTSVSLKHRILTELVKILVPSTIGLLTVNEFKELFPAVMSSAPLDDAFIVLINALHSYDGSQMFSLQHVIILLDNLEKICLEALLVDSIKKDPDDLNWDVKLGELCRLLGQTTCLLHNAIGSSHSSNLIKSSGTLLEAYLNNHWIYLHNAIKAALIHAEERCQNAKNVNLKFVAGVIHELCRGDITTFRLLVDWLGSLAENPIWSRFSARLFTDRTNGLRQLESLVMCVLVAVKDGEVLMRLFGNEIHENRVVRRIFFEKALFVKVFPASDRIPEKLAVCLQFGNRKISGDKEGPWCALHGDTIRLALDVWANNIHVNHSSDEQLDYTELVLLNLVKYANKHVRHAVISEATSSITAAVNIRLKCSNIRRKLRGMYVAEVMTKWFSLGELKFEYPSTADEHLLDLKKIVDNETVVAQKPSASDSEEKKMVELGIEDVKDVTGHIDSDDDDDFPTYEIPEEEKVLNKEGNDDYHRVEVPHYIRDCIEGLNESDDYAKFEAAFNALGPMIRRRAVGYDQSSEQLLRRLLDLTDRFKTENFQEKRLQLIVSCLVVSPHLGSVAVEMMFSRRCSMMNRYTILKAISDAALEYSSSPGSAIVDKESQILKNEGKVLVNGQLVPRTRRFAKASTPSQKVNDFTPMANSFFYPLTAIDQHREHLDLLGRDSELLSRILFCMGQLIKCSGSCPCTIRMASTLTYILMPLRHHENSAVRQAVLFGYASICVSLSKEVLLQFYSEELVDWCKYTAKLAKADPSSECRQMAQMAAGTIAQRITDQEN